MTRLIVAIALTTLLIAAATAGWLARERRAIEDCHALGGKWSQVGGYCYGHSYGEAQE